MSEYVQYGDQDAELVDLVRERVSDRDRRENLRILADYQRFLDESSGLNDNDPALD